VQLFPIRNRNGWARAEVTGTVKVGADLTENTPRKLTRNILGYTGAVAFSRTGDPASGDFPDATVLRKFGDVPDDLSAL